MVARRPLVMATAGHVEELPGSDTIAASAFPWLVPPPPGTWWNANPGSTGTQALTVGDAYVWPVLVPAMTIDSIAIQVATLGATSLVRAGFVTVGTVGGDTKITGVLDDMGTVSGATVGAGTFTSGLVWPGGVLWCLIVGQTAACTLRSSGAGYGVPVPFGTTAEVPTAGASAHTALVSVGVTGAIPATAALASSNAAPPKVFFKRA